MSAEADRLAADELAQRIRQHASALRGHLLLAQLPAAMSQLRQVVDYSCELQAELVHASLLRGITPSTIARLSGVPLVLVNQQRSAMVAALGGESADN